MNMCTVREIREAIQAVSYTHLDVYKRQAQAGLEDVRAKLLTLGFPEEVLNDLAPEDLEACRDGVEVVVDVTGETFSEDGRGPEELRVTGVGVRLAGERERWVLIHHFLWTEDPGFYGTESVQLWLCLLYTSE